MKKILAVVLCLAIILAVSLAFLGCDDLSQEGQKQITLIIGEERHDVTTEVLFLIELLEELNIPFTSENSPFGVFVTSVGTLQPASNQYISFWVSSDNLRIANPHDTFNPPITVSGITFNYAQLGIMAMPLWCGFAYLIQIGTF
jgi:hypothetical protein